ncbi:MAG: folylpolyglutamate synthase/dihydrofolate synthase family protein [Spirochaetota bacterium]|nr:folylpolyglutamate synthase/dihydrofolate synthase family protein [Spirochaetota bacterium]
MLPHYLQSLANNESHASNFTNYSPDTIVAVLNLLGNPHHKLPCIHIAGTNGKGSTAHMIAAILQTAGYTVGLYTSPHLIRYNERISINGKEITDEEISEYAEMLETLCKTHSYTPTFFDAFTTIAFLHFYNSVDIAVIETGLGGRLDSTNVVTPLISVITPISYDHTAILGSTLHEIAYQKAGIIKKHIPVISATQKPEAKEVLQKEASMNQSPIFFVGDHISFTIVSQSPLVFDVMFNHSAFNQYKNFNNIRCSLLGDFQAANASVAIATALMLKKNNWAIVPENIYNAMSNLYIPGRCEILSKKPLVIFDCAHNPQALEHTIRNICKHYVDYEKIFCTSFMKDKDVTKMLSIIHRFTSKPLFYFQIPDSRCYIPDEEIKKIFSLHVFTETKSLAKILKPHINSNTMVIFIGTFRLYPYSRPICLLLQ